MTGAPSPMCPCCGYNFRKDEPVTIDGWSIDPFSNIVTHNGTPVKLTGGMTAVLHTIAALRGKVITTDAILNRVSDSDCHNLIYVVLTQMRKRLTRHGIPAPWESVWGKGYRWAPKA